MDRQLAWRVLQAQTKEFLRRWPQPEVADWMDAAGEFVERHLAQFISVETNIDEEHKLSEVPAAPPGEARFPEFASKIVKTSFTDSCPVIIETNPTYANLFGTISPPPEGNPGVQHIAPGAMLRAEGGYLVLRCLDVLRENGVWHQLKRALQTGHLEIREFDQGSGTQTGSLQPEAIPIDIKVVLIGEPGVYEQLAAEDGQFPQIFKIHAEFDSTIPVDEQNLTRYADYLQWLVDAHDLRPFAAGAMAAVAEYGARAAGRRDRSSRATASSAISRARHRTCARARAPRPWAASTSKPRCACSGSGTTCRRSSRSATTRRVTCACRRRAMPWGRSTR
jgi:hypothetical protein